MSNIEGAIIITGLICITILYIFKTLTDSVTTTNNIENKMLKEQLETARKKILDYEYEKNMEIEEEIENG